MFIQPRPKSKVHFTPAQSDNQQTLTMLMNHTHIMLTQLNIRDGLKGYGNKGDKAILKDVIQLHTRQLLMPCSRDEMSHDERSKQIGQSRHEVA
jgi:hypothetical protein